MPSPLRNMRPGEVWCSKDREMHRVRIMSQAGERVRFYRTRGPSAGRESQWNLSRFLAAYQPDVRPTDGREH